MGSRTIQILVTADDGSSTEIYYFEITRRSDTDATLSGLAVSDGEGNAVALTPAFASTTTSYTASVDYDVTEIRVSPTRSDENATVEYLDENNAVIADADNAENGQQVSLDVGQNTVKVKVTAEYGNTTETYTLVATREPPRELEITPTTLTIGEDGLGGFAVELSSQPTAQVTVAISSDDTGAAVVSDSSLSFTTANWDTAQTVTVTGVQDDDTSDESLTVSLSAASTDGDYQGKTGSVAVSVTDDQITNNAATGQPAITGDAQVAETLSATKGDIADADGTTKADNDDMGYAYAYQWLLVDAGAESSIPGATGATYTPVVGDVGKKVKVTVSFTDDLGNSESRTSAAYPASSSIVSSPNNPPVFSDDASATREFTETVGADTETSARNIGSAVVATDDDGDALTYTLEGTDGSKFAVVDTSGQVQTRTGANYDYESATTHSVRVKVEDGNGGSDTIDVAIHVADVAEVPLRPAAPTVTTGGAGSLSVSWTAPNNAGRLPSRATTSDTAREPAAPGPTARWT